MAGTPLIVGIAGVIIIGATIGLNLMSDEGSADSLQSLVREKKIVVDVDSDENSFELSITAGAVNYGETISFGGKGEVEVAASDGVRFTQKCWEYKMSFIVEEPTEILGDADCIHYTGSVKHTCDPNGVSSFDSNHLMNPRK